MLYLAGIFILIAILILIIFFTGKPGIFTSQRSILSSRDLQRYRTEWQEIKSLTVLGGPSQLKQAVIQADRLVEQVLRILYPAVKTNVERYKKAEILFSDKKSYDDLWYAHKARNELVHNLNFELPYAQAIDVINKYQEALKTLGIDKL